MRISIAYGYLFTLSVHDNFIHAFIIFTIFLGCFLQIDGLMNSYLFRKFNSIKKRYLLKNILVSTIILYFLISILSCISFYLLGYEYKSFIYLLIFYTSFFLRFCDSFLKYRIDILKILKIDFFTLSFGLILLTYTYLNILNLGIEDIFLLFIFPMFLNGFIKLFYFCKYIKIDRIFTSRSHLKLQLFDKDIFLYLQYLISAGFIFNLIILIINHFSYGLFFSTSFLFTYRLLSAVAELSSIPLNTSMPQLTKSFYTRKIGESIFIYKKTSLLSFILFITFTLTILLFSNFYNSLVNYNISIVNKDIFLILSLFLLSERILSFNLNFNLSINLFYYQPLIILYWAFLILLSYICFYLNSFILLFIGFSILCFGLYFIITKQRGLYLSRLLMGNVLSQRLSN